MQALLLLETVALVGATVHPFSDDAQPTVANVIVEDGRITAVGPDVAVPEGAETVDLTGLHLVPGLIDGMANHDADHDALYISHGVTLVRDTGNDLARIIPERDPEARNRVPGPDLYIAGAVLDGNPPSTTSAVVATSAEEARLKLERLVELEVDFLSVQTGLPKEPWIAAIEVAHEAGIQLWGPVPAAVGLAEAIERGQDGLIGLQFLLPPGGSWHTVEPVALEPQIEAVTAAGLPVTPLLQVYGRILAERDEALEELRWLGPHYESGWRGELALWRSDTSGELAAATERSLTAQRGALKELYDAGVPLVPGSGAPNPWLLPGRALVEELEQWVRAGIPTYDALRLATAGAARVLGVDDERGTIAPGRIADLIALGSDPRESLTPLAAPELVVLRGRVFEREELEDLLTRLESAQSLRREAINQPVEIPDPDVPPGDKILAGRAETVASGTRVSAERFIVVRLVDGRLAYCTRIRTPGSATVGASEVHLVQTVKDGRLERFETIIRTGEHILTVNGVLIGGLMNVERRLDGYFVDNNRAREPISLVDVGSVTAPMLLGQHFKEGASYVIFFEDTDPVVGRWELKVSEEDGKLLLRTGEGWMVCGLRPDGAPAFSMRQVGNAHAEVRLDGVTAFGGPGLAPEKRRVYRPEDDRARATAGSQNGGAAREATAGEKEKGGER